MTHILDLFAWLTRHPGQAATIVAAIIAAACIIGAAVYGLACSHEERQQDEQRQRLEALINLSSEQRSKLPPALGARPPRPRKNPVRAAGLASERKAVS